MRGIVIVWTCVFLLWSSAGSTRVFEDEDDDDEGSSATATSPSQYMGLEPEIPFQFIPRFPGKELGIHTTIMVRHNMILKCSCITHYLNH